MRYPDEQQALALLRKYRLPKEIVEHSKRVVTVAVKIAKQIKAAGNDADVGLVKSAAMLHDIGKWRYLHRKREIAHMHAYESGRLLRELGWPEFAAVCEAHFAVTKEVAEKFDFPEPHDTIPKTVEAKIIFISDKIRPGRETLRQMVEYFERSSVLRKKYWSKCPGFKESSIAEVKKVWRELEKLGMMM